MKKFLSRNHLVAVAIALLAFIVYLPGFWWGAPHATAPDRKQSWGVDDETPLGPLAEIHNIIQPKPDRNLGYPLMYSFVVAAAYTPYLVYLWLTGQFTTISGVYPFGLVDPVGVLKVLTYIAHLVTVFMGVGVVVAAFDIGRALWNRSTGILAALFVMTSFPMFYYARSGNVDVPVLFFIALATAVFIRCLVYGFTVQRAIMLGIFVGFAMGTKESALGSFLAMPVVLFFLQWRANKGLPGLFSWRFWKAPLAGAFASITAFGVGSGLFVDPQRYFDHIQFIAGRVESITGGELIIGRVFPYTWAGHFQFARQIGEYLIDMMTLPGLLLALLGVIWVVVRREKKGAVLALVAATYLAYIFLTLRTGQMRYLMPLAFILAFFAARIVTAAWEARRPTIQIGLAVIALGVIGVGLLRGMALTYEMINDSRFAAAAWLASETEPGDRVEYFGPVQLLPPLEAEVITEPATEYFGIFVRTRTDEAKAQEILQGWRARQPDFIILMPDLTSRPGSPYNISCPPSLCDALLDDEIAGYRRAAYFETPPLFPWLTVPALDYPTINAPIHIFVPKNMPFSEEVNFMNEIKSQE